MTQEEGKSIFRAHCETAWGEWRMKSNNGNVATEDDIQWVMKRAIELTRAAMEYGGGSFVETEDGGFYLAH